MGKSNPSLFKSTPAAPGERHFADIHTIKSVLDKFLPKDNNIFGQGVKTKEFDKEKNRFGNDLDTSVKQYESVTFYVDGKKVLVNEISNNMVDRYLDKTFDASLGRKPPITDGNTPAKPKDVAKGRVAAFSIKSKKIGEGKLEEVSTNYLLKYLRKASKTDVIRSVRDPKSGAKAASRLNFIDHANSIVDDGQKKYHESKIELVKSTILKNRKK